MAKIGTRRVRNRRDLFRNVAERRDSRSMDRRRRRWLTAFAAAGLLAVAAAVGAGPGGWDHLGTGSTPTFPSLNGAVDALHVESSGELLVGGAFTDAGGDANADSIARWDGRAWKALGASALHGAVLATASRGGKVYAGGLFTDAGGNPDADYLAVWDGRRWGPACKSNGPALTNPVYALQIVGSTLYVGGTFQNGGGVAAADFLLACDLNTGAPRATVGTAEPMVGGGVYALAADSRGRLYAGGGFSRVAGIAAANKVAYLDAGGWHALGAGKASGGAAIGLLVRSLVADGTDVYVGTDSVDIAGIPLADHVAKWNGSAWSALGSNASGKDGWFPPTSFVYSLAVSGSRVFAGGGWVNADGDPLADRIAVFDGKKWGPVGSNGSGDGPFNGTVSALATFGRKLYAGGMFSNGGGDRLARFAASYPLGAAPGGEGPPTTTTTTPSTGPIPPPTATSTGAVLVNGRPFATGTIPYNATVDVTRGSVALRTTTGTLTVRGAGGITAIFKLVRGTDNGRPVVELRLSGGNFGVCPKRRPASAARAAAKTVRQVWGDGQGRFRTAGRYASATVRGTNWLTADRCDGTFVRVRRGVVQVRDVPRRRQVIVRAGSSYLARP
jgi:hypothetical protein